MTQKRTLYSLLLTSLILVFAFSFSMAQDVIIQDKTVAKCASDFITVDVDVPSDVSAFEIVLDVSGTGGADFSALAVTFDPGLTVLTNRVVDISGNTVRIAGMLINAGDACLGSGLTTVARLEFTANDACSGTVEITGTSFSCPNSNVTASSQFIDCASGLLVAATVTSGTVTIINNAPTIDPIANATIHWGQTYNATATADDDDLANGCENLTFSVNGPAGMSIGSSSGVISWTTGGGDICEHLIEVTVTDDCGESASTSFTICVQNDAPTITAEDPDQIIWGNTSSGTVTGNDPDNGPSPLAYSVVSFGGPGTVSVNPADGSWSWPTLEDNAYIGCFALKIKVTDGANICSPCSPRNADTVTITVCVIPTIRLTIEKTHNTLQGHFETVSIDLDPGIDPGNLMGGFDLLIKYDASALTFNGALPGQLVLDCGWEYFTYRYGVNGNCGPSACPSGIVRIVAIAETNNGDNHPVPDCLVGSQLAELSFLVTNDRTFECQYVPIRFIWYDCGDNAISSVSGDSLYISRHIYDFDNPNPIEADVAFPSLYGANSSCDVALDDGKPDPIRLIDFWNGGIDIVCADSIDDRGDINLNKIAYEIADAVVLTNYFIFGLSAFDVNVEGQIAASDVNADGIVLSVADLVYLIRVVVGDALPYPKEISTVAVNYTHAGDGLMSVNDVRIGAAYLVVAGNTAPQLLADNMEMAYNFDGINTRILVYSLEANSFTGDFLNVRGDLISIEMATDEGNQVAAKAIPTEFALKQNYPNPFNPTTTIAFALPSASDYELKVYNVNGQEVAAFAGTHEAGVVEIDWDAANRASGIYFYKLVAGNYSATKKMVLLK